jgi:predicted kinase
MSDLLSRCPAPPAWCVPWDDVDREWALVRALRGCPQDARHHAEGDVWIHTRMVCEELAALPAWRALPEDERRALFAAAVLHDTGKPDCTRTDPDGRISARGHSRRGAILARSHLWRANVPFGEREQIAALIRYHQVPYFLIDHPDARRLTLEVSQSARCDHLAILAEADVRGRVCEDLQRMLDNVALFAEQAREEGCWSSPYAFPSAHTRVIYFLDEGRQPEVPVHEDLKADVVLMAGLPGSGKDHFIRTHLPDWPVISLDALREELDVSAAEKQGEVVSEARDRARDYLRAGRNFVWNGTNVSRQLRRQSLQLLLSYRARVRIVYVEVPPAVLFPQNRRRPAPVPEKVIERLIDRWEVPDLCEAHRLDYVVRG